MKKPEVLLIVTKEDTGYSAYASIGDIFIGTQGETMEELKEMAVDAVNLSFEENGWKYTEDDIKFEFDLGRELSEVSFLM